jgi:nucleoside phosphorylase
LVVPTEDAATVERIAIFAALHWECRPVLRQMRQVARQRAGDFTVWRGSTARRQVVLVKTGMGVAHAAAAARAVRDRGEYALFLSTGCAGALAAELVPGDVTVATAIVGTSRNHFETDPDHRIHAQRAAERAALRVASGLVLCSPLALATAEQKRTAARQYGAVAVEMEGAAIAAEAAARGIPFLSVRTILDTADTELWHAGRVIDPQTGAVKSLALAGYLAAHPTAVSEVLAMQRMMHAAQTSLERFFAAWFSILDSYGDLGHA